LSVVVSRVVGDGRSKLFWSDVWVDGVAFRDMVGRLFDLSLYKEASVFAMSQLGWGEDGGAWMWRRGLFVWEEELLGELCLLLHNVNLQVDKEDRCLWHLESSTVFTLRSAYKHLVNQHNTFTTVSPKDLWHKDIPLKVVLFAWRLIRGRLPTKDNLFRHRIIGPDDGWCVGGCGMMETSPHLFLHCQFFGKVWHFIHLWLGVCSVIPNMPADYLNQFAFVGGFCSKRQLSILQLIWYATV